jgi:hypothetical protein
MSEDAQSYDFIQQTPPARESIDPRVKAQIEAENQALLEQARQRKAQTPPPHRRQGGFAFIQPTPPARRAFGDPLQRG